MMRRNFSGRLLLTLALNGVLGILGAQSKNLLNNGTLTLQRPVATVAKELRDGNVVVEGTGIPLCWMPRSADGKTVTCSAADGKLSLAIPGGKAQVVYHHTNVLASVMKTGHHYRPSIEGEGDCAITFSMYVYDEKGRYLKKLSGLSSGRIAGKKTILPPFTVPETPKAALYTPIWEITGKKIIIDTFLLEEVDELSLRLAAAEIPSPLPAPAGFRQEFAGLGTEEKKALIRTKTDVAWLLAAACDADKAAAGAALRQLVVGEPDLPDGALPILMRLGSDENMTVRARACHLLGAMEERALPAVDLLKKNLTAPSEGVVSSSAVALTRMGKALCPVLRDLMLSGNRSVRLSIALAVRGMPGGVPPELKDAVDWASPRVVQSGSSLHPNSGFEAGMDGWRVEFLDGARGSWEITEKRAAGGRRSLKLVKTNARGYIRLISTQPVVLPPDRARRPWTFRARFQSFTSSTDVFLVPRLVSENNTHYGDDGGGMNAYYSWTSQYQIRNTPDAFWDKRVILFRPRADGELRLRPAMLLFGEPAEIWLDDLEFPAPAWQGIYAGRIYAQPEYSRKEMLAVVAGRPRVSVKCSSENGRTVVSVNGRAVTPSIHMSWPTTGATADFREMEKAGVTFPLISLSMQGAASLPPYGESWNGKNEAVFDDFFASIEASLRQNPHGNYIIGLNLLWPPDYVDKNPGEAWLDEKGRRAYGHYGHMLGFASKLPEQPGLFWWPSQYSRKFLETYGNLFRKFLIELKKKPYAHIIAGIRMGGGHDFQFTIHSGVRDYSVHARNGFREFLREKYKTDRALAEAWSRPGIRIDSVSIPPLKQASSENAAFYAQDNIDYEQFRARQEWIVPEYFARIFKEEMGTDKLALTWHMGEENDHSHFLKSRWLDATQSQPNYGMRMRGYSGGMNVEDLSFNLHGKLSVKELDTRTWLRSDGNETFTMWVGTPLDEEQFRDQLFKEAGQTFVQNQGYCFFDFTGGYRHPAIFRTFRTITRVNRRLVNARKRISFFPEVAVIRNAASRNTPLVRDNAVWRLNETSWMLLDLRTAGVPFVICDLSDLMRRPELLKRIKVAVLPDSVFLNPAERDFIRQTLKKDGRTLIVCYASGFYNGKHYDDRNISAVADMKVTAEPISSTKRFSVLAAESADPLAENLTPLQSHTVSFNEAAFFGAEWRYKGIQRFHIDDPGAVVLGRYTDDGGNAIGVKRFPTHTTIYCASPGGLSPDLLRNAAAEAGAFTAADQAGLVVDLNDRFLSIHCLKSGSYTIRLPSVSKVIDAFTGKVVARKTDSLTENLTAQRTVWYLLEDPE